MAVCNGSQHCRRLRPNHGLPGHTRNCRHLVGGWAGEGLFPISPTVFLSGNIELDFKGQVPSLRLDKVPRPVSDDTPLFSSHSNGKTFRARRSRSRTPGELGKSEAHSLQVRGEGALGYSSWVFPSLLTHEGTQTQQLKWFSI